MSKRFIVDKDFVDYPKLIDTETDCFYHFEDSLRNVEIFCERLNILVDENDELRQELAEHLALHSNWIIRKDKFEKTLLQENKRLQKDRNNLAEECSALFQQNGRLKKENEELRNSIKAFLEEADIFSEEATKHDLNAYRELNRFDNKDAYYLACAIAELKKVICNE